MPDLKLLALDEEDLEVISTYVQDAVLRVVDMGFAKSDARFACVMNRYAWEEGDQQKQRQRRRCAMHFDHVTNVTSTGIDLSAHEGVLDLLFVGFKLGQAPAGIVELVFAGGGSVQLSVECLEAHLSDLGARWSAKSMPDHELDQN